MVARILIVDDSRTTVEVVKVHLMNQGYEFVATFASTTALDLARDALPNLIISDLTMPGLSGIELCKRVRMVPALQRIPFVLVTANKEESVRRQAFAAGVDGFLRKPIASDRLQTLVSELLGKRGSVPNPL